MDRPQSEDQNRQRRKLADPAERDGEIRSRGGRLGNRATLFGQCLLTCGTQAFGRANRQIKRTFVQTALDLVGGLEFFAVSHDDVCQYC